MICLLGEGWEEAPHYHLSLKHELPVILQMIVFLCPTRVSVEIRIRLFWHYPPYILFYHSFCFLHILVDKTLLLHLLLSVHLP